MTGNRLPRRILKWETVGSGRKERTTERYMEEVRRCVTKYGLSVGNRRHRAHGERFGGSTVDNSEMCHHRCVSKH